MRRLVVLALLGPLGGCVAYTVAETAVEVTAAVVETAVDVTTGAVRLVIPDGDDEEEGR